MPSCCSSLYRATSIPVHGTAAVPPAELISREDTGDVSLCGVTKPPRPSQGSPGCTSRSHTADLVGVSSGWGGNERYLDKNMRTFELCTEVATLGAAAESFAHHVLRSLAQVWIPSAKGAALGSGALTAESITEQQCLSLTLLCLLWPLCMPCEKTRCSTHHPGASLCSVISFTGG